LVMASLSFAWFTIEADADLRRRDAAKFGA
jgi:hypothetical protein